MTTHAAAVQAINAAFVAAWPTDVPYVLDNSAPDPASEEQAILWVEDGPEEVQETLAPVGERSWENRGTVVVEVYVAIGSGTGRADALADPVRAAFRGKTIAGCIFRGASRVRVGEVSQWYKVVIRAPFQYYDRS